MKVLKQKYIFNKNITCEEDKSQLEFYNFAGLWIMLGCALILSLIMHVTYTKYKSVHDGYMKRKKNFKDKKVLVKDWSCPYIMGGDFIENPTPEIVELIVQASRSRFLIYLYIYIYIIRILKENGKECRNRD